MTRILSVATAGVYTEQLTAINHHRFPRVDYIELPHHLNVETVDARASQYSCLNVEDFKAA